MPGENLPPMLQIKWYKNQLSTDVEKLSSETYFKNFTKKTIINGLSKCWPYCYKSKFYKICTFQVHQTSVCNVG